jgi:general stress protein 26
LAYAKKHAKLLVAKEGEMEQVILDILNHVPFGCLGTVDADGYPWSVPLHFATDGRQIYWFSMPDAKHSENIVRHPAISFAVWTPDRIPNLHGVCISSVAHLVEDEYELEIGNTTFTQKFPEIPEAFAGYNMYAAPIGEIDRAKSVENKWYLTITDEYKFNLHKEERGSETLYGSAQSS